jgi:PAS domain S-box-containing protein
MNLDDLQRLDELRRYELFDDGPDAAFGVLAELAASVCEAPIGYISFIDERHQRLVARWGIPSAVPDLIPKEESICAQVVAASPLVLIIENLAADERFGRLPVVEQLGLIFYAGASLVTPTGYVLGTVCVVDYKERQLVPRQTRGLGLVRDQVMELLEARRELGELRRSESLRQEAVEALVATQHDLTHRIELRTREIEEAHHKTRLLLERIGDGYVALDREWRYVYVNERAAQLLQRTPAELVGKNIWTAFPEGVGQPFQRAYERAMREQQIISLEAYHEPWGRWFENRIYPSANGVAVFFTETTDRKKAEEEAEKNRARLVEAQQVAHVGSFEFDMINNSVAWSDELYRIYGVPIGTTIAGYEGFLERVHPDDLESTQRIVGEAIAAGTTMIYDHRIVRSDGAVRMLHTRGEAIAEDGKTVRLVGCCWDVTELVETTDALHRTVALLEATLEVTSDGLLVVDAAGIVSAHNAAAAALFALPRNSTSSLARVAERLRDAEPLLARSRSLSPNESVETLALKDGRLLEARSRPHVVDGSVAGRVWSFRLAPTA